MGEFVEKERLCVGNQAHSVSLLITSRENALQSQESECNVISSNQVLTIRPMCST